MQSVLKDYDDMRADIRIIRDTLQEAKGGWRVLMLVGGGCAAAGGAIVKFLPVVFK